RTDTHMFLYLPVRSNTGKIWLNNNLGADYANLKSPAFNLAQQARSVTDSSAYGSYFQWGRKADGHELFNTRLYRLYSRNDPNTIHYYASLSSGYNEWRATTDHSLWSREDSPNNVCPVGWRVPTAAEFNEELHSWGPVDYDYFQQQRYTQYTSPLKLTFTGQKTYMNQTDGAWWWINHAGCYYTSTKLPDQYCMPSAAVLFVVTDQFSRMHYSNHAYGNAVRCIKN
ncbi:MAG: hypothetical protein DSZ09_03180, partial [Sulfurovum sp.]